tara:strand:+ start:156 stop:821 length:666 start_codon:yes stop_codon:yes gene_type:complete
MDYFKYKGSGSGLDKIALTKLYYILNSLNGDINILEFGSGQSTQFFIDYKLQTNKNISILSYDNDPNYCFKNTEKFDFLDLKIKNLIKCNNNDFVEMLNSKTYDKNKFAIADLLPYNHPKFWRQRNCFYDINSDELNIKYDLIIIDGPNGNGRNIAYLHLQNCVKPGSIIFIDDFNASDGDYDYKFIENLKNILNVEEIETFTNNNPSWEFGCNFAIYKVI